MPRALPARSWQVTSAAFHTPALACVGLVATLGVCEIAFRLPAVRAALHAPSFGSPSRRFELQLDGLDRYAGPDGRVQCIVLGNSTALMGVDPQALNRGHQKRSGRPLRCFNFGVAGMTASAAAAVAPILVERYRPSLLIYVVSVRDIGESVDGPLLANMPWVQSRRGTFSVNGWLVEHAATFRYYLLYRQWLDPSRWPAARSSAGTTAEGFFPAASRLALSPALWAHTQRAYMEVASLPPSESEIAGFTRLLEISTHGVHVVVVEAPVREELRRWVARTTDFYATATARLRHAARRQRIRVWRVATWRVIPADGWFDFVHLNASGAASFSEWIGARIAAEGRRTTPAASAAPG